MPFFYQPPVWDKFNLQFGTGFISISLDFHPYLLISTRQMAIQGSQVFLWAFIHICSSQQGRWQSRESFADQLHHILIIFQGLTNNARCRASPCRPRIVCRFFVLSSPHCVPDSRASVSETRLETQMSWVYGSNEAYSGAVWRITTQSKSNRNLLLQRIITVQCFHVR